MRMLYKYPQAAFPYARPGRREPAPRPRRARVRAGRHRRLRRRSLLRRRSSSTPRPTPEDILMRITVANRGPEAAPLHLLPTVWFRNTWSWGGRSRRGRFDARRARAGQRHDRGGDHALRAALALLPRASRRCCSPRTRRTRCGCSASPARATSRTASTTASCTARADAVNPARTGTKAAAHYALDGSRRRDASASACGSRRRGAETSPTASPFADVRRRVARRASARPTSSTPTVIPRDLDRRRARA